MSIIKQTLAPAREAVVEGTERIDVLQKYSDLLKRDVAGDTTQADAPLLISLRDKLGITDDEVHSDLAAVDKSVEASERGWPSAQPELESLRREHPRAFGCDDRPKAVEPQGVRVMDMRAPFPPQERRPLNPADYPQGSRPLN